MLSWSNEISINIHSSICINPDRPRFIFLCCSVAFKGWSKNSGIVIITYQIDHFNLTPEKIMQHDKNPLPPTPLGIIRFSHVSFYLLMNLFPRFAAESALKGLKISTKVHLIDSENSPILLVFDTLLMQPQM